MKHIIIASFCLCILFQSCKREEKTDSRNKVFINTKPDSVRIFLSDKEIGISPISFKVPQGIYILEFQKEGYKTVFRRIICEPGKDINLEVALDPITSSVLILSSPSKSKVIKDEKELGETPLVISDNSIGKHSASISKPGYVTQEINWTVEDARPQEVFVTLSSNMGKLNLKSEPAGADVLIDGKFVGRTPYSDSIEQGEKKIVMQKQGYTVFEQTIAVVREQEKSITAKLTILPGSLTVKTEPPGALLFLDNQPYKETPFTVKDLIPGNYKIRVVKEGYDNSEQEVNILPGRESSVNITLSTNLGGIDLLANPPGVIIYLDGKKMGETEPEGNSRLISKIFEIRGVTSGKHILTASHPRAIPSEKSVTVTVAKGEVSRPKPISLWIADTYMKTKNGAILHGRIHQENENEVVFEPEPGIRQRFGRDEISELRKLGDKD